MRTAIIISSGKTKNILFPGVYDLMVSINGKRVINYILENCEQWNITRIILLIDRYDIETQRYIKFINLGNIELSVELTDIHVLNILDCLKKILIKDEEILIHFGDVIYNENIDFSKDCIFTSDNQNLKNNISYISCDDVLFSKNNNMNKLGFNFSGIFFIKNISRLNFYLESIYTFYDLLNIYLEEHDEVIINKSNKFYNINLLEDYHRIKFDFLRTRSFNYLKYDVFRGILTKTSSNKEKILLEMNWFNSLPKDLQIFTPRLIDYKNQKQAEYSIEFYGYPSLGDIFLQNSNNNFVIFKNILGKIFNYISYIRYNYKIENFRIENFYDMYLNKTLKRLDAMLSDTFFNKLYSLDFIVINGKKYHNIRCILNNADIEKIIQEKIYIPEDCTIIHGDLCFSNILFDVNSGILKFIDPRGNFGETGIYGDIKYDIAKLRHSINGFYESIIADLFFIKCDVENFDIEFKYFNEKNEELIEFFDSEIQKMGFQLNVIKFIEGLLFLTMIPLHSDSFNRQLMMYVTAVILFNEIS